MNKNNKGRIKKFGRIEFSEDGEKIDIHGFSLEGCHINPTNVLRLIIEKLEKTLKDVEEKKWLA